MVLASLYMIQSRIVVTLILNSVLRNVVLILGAQPLIFMMIQVYQAHVNYTLRIMIMKAMEFHQIQTSGIVMSKLSATIGRITILKDTVPVVQIMKGHNKLTLVVLTQWDPEILF